MTFYKFIKTRGLDGADIGYLVPHMYKLVCCRIVLRVFKLSYVKERLAGWTIWWVEDENDYRRAIDTLNELKKIYVFDYRVSE